MFVRAVNGSSSGGGAGGKCLLFVQYVGGAITKIVEDTDYLSESSNVITFSQACEGWIVTGLRYITPTSPNATITKLSPDAGANYAGNLYEFSSVKNAINGLNAKEKFAYADTGGTQEFKESIAKWLFGDCSKSP